MATKNIYQGKTIAIKVGNNVTINYTLDIYEWGIAVLIESIIPNKPTSFSMRRFKFTPKYQSYDSLVMRINSYYNINF